MNINSLSRFSLANSASRALKALLCLFAIVCLVSLTTACDDDSSESVFPERPVPARLVNDLANLMSPDEVALLEDSLLSFARVYGPQIVVITVNDLQGYDKAEYAYEIGHRWGVGKKEANNGVVMLVKPKTENEKGHAFIATGYGLEGNLPDIICGRIVDEVMIPFFKNNDYTSGIYAGVNSVMLASQGYSYIDEEYMSQLGSFSPSEGGEGSDADDDLDFQTVMGIILIIGGALLVYFLCQWFLCVLVRLFFAGLGRLFGWNSSDSDSDSSSDSGSWWSDFSSSSDDFDFGGGDFGGGGGGGDW